jgi:hypothetical protein
MIAQVCHHLLLRSKKAVGVSLRHGGFPPPAPSPFITSWTSASDHKPVYRYRCGKTSYKPTYGPSLQPVPLSVIGLQQLAAYLQRLEKGKHFHRAHGFDLT